MVEALSHLHLQPEPPRPVDRHMAARLRPPRPCGPCPFRRRHRHRACADQVRLTQEIFGGDLGYLPWQRPGIDLGIKLGELAERNPHLKGVVLGQHGLFTWADTAKDCYLLTLEMINKAAVWLDANVNRPVFGGERTPALPAQDRKAEARRLMPLIRGRISASEMKSGHFTDAPEVLDFVTPTHSTRWPPSAPRAPTTSCARRSSRWSSPQRRCRDPRHPHRAIPRRLRRLLRPLQNAPTPPPSATPTRWST